jgi:oxygen-dependent protoporphyrinogen oxidase
MDMTPLRSSSSVVVVGAGVAGLSAAWTLDRAGHHVTVLDSGPRAGGKLWADEFGGHLVDRGADAFLARVPDAVDLCHELGIGDDLVAPASRTAFLLRDGRLHRFPDGLVLGVPTDFEALEASGVVSSTAVTRARRDLDDPAPPLPGDTTVGRYVRDRVGDEVYETLVSPLLSGINAGDADQLSLEAGAPQLAAAAHAGGSLVDHLRRQRLRNLADPEAPVFHSLAGGAGQLVVALVDRLGASIEYGSPAASIASTGTRYTITLDDGTERSADGVVLATPGWVSGPLIEASAPRSAADLAALGYASVAVVTFSFALDQVDHDLDGRGFLVPEREGLLMTACSWGSSKWPGWADPGAAVLRVSVGRSHDARADDLDDGALVAHLTAELARTVGASGSPTDVLVSRWPRALPQYRPGHLDRVDAWEVELAQQLPRVALAGASTRGLGVPACVASGRAAARAVARQLE